MQLNPIWCTIVAQVETLVARWKNLNTWPGSTRARRRLLHEENDEYRVVELLILFLYELAAYEAFDSVISTLHTIFQKGEKRNRKAWGEIEILFISFKKTHKVVLRSEANRTQINLQTSIFYIFSGWHRKAITIKTSIVWEWILIKLNREDRWIRMARARIEFNSRFK